MNEFALKLLNMSISAGWMALAVILLRLLLRKAPKWLMVLAWGLVGLRLLLPFTIPSPLSLIPSEETVRIESGAKGAETVIDSGIPAVDGVLNPALRAGEKTETGTPIYFDEESAGEKTPEGSGSETAAESEKKETSFPLLGAIWAAGVVVMLLYAAVSYFSLRRSVGDAIRTEKGIWRSDGVKSPFILGLFRPRIYLPSSMDEETAGYVIAHEKAHLQRKDHWWKPVGYLLLAVYWFHPLLWVAYVLLCRDIEFAADEKAIRERDREWRAAYSSALLAASMPRRRVAACPLAFGEVGTKARIKSLLNYKKPAFWIVIAAVLALAVTATCLLTGPMRRDAGETEPAAEGGLWGQTKALPDGDAVFTEGRTATGLRFETIKFDGVYLYYSMARDGDGYLLLADFDEEGMQLLRLDRDFRIVSKEPVEQDGSEIYAFLDPGKSGEKAFTVEERSVGAASGMDATRPFVCRDGEPLFSAANAAGGYNFIHLLPTEDGLWAINFNFLLLDGKQAKLPEPDPGYMWQGRGFLNFGGTNYAVMGQSKDYSMPEEWYLLELRGKEIGEVRKTNLQGNRFMMGEGAPANVFFHDSRFAFADGEKILLANDIEKEGLDLGGDINGCWREKDRIVMLLGSEGIVVATDSGEPLDGAEGLVIGAVAPPQAAPEAIISLFNREKRGVVTIKRYENEEKLNLALLSKEVDLIWDYDPEILFDRAKAGALEPIGDYMDLSVIYPNLVSLGSRDGKCWFLPADFKLEGMILPESAAGGRGYFRSMEEFDKALGTLPEKEVYLRMTRGSLLRAADPMEWVDPETNACDFQNENFLKLLEIDRRLAENQEIVEANPVGEYNPLFETYVNSKGLGFTWGLEAQNLYYNRRHPESGVSDASRFMPYPGNGRFAGFAVNSYNLVAVSAGSDKKEEIKTFLTYLFSEEAARAAVEDAAYAFEYFPNQKVNKALIDERIDRAREAEENGGYVDIHHTKEEYEKGKEDVAAAIASGDHWYAYAHGELKKIMEEECARYFAGEITAEKAAEYIQNRISLMLAERG